MATTYNINKNVTINSIKYNIDKCDISTTFDEQYNDIYKEFLKRDMNNFLTQIQGTFTFQQEIDTPKNKLEEYPVIPMLESNDRDNTYLESIRRMERDFCNISRIRSEIIYNQCRTDVGLSITPKKGFTMEDCIINEPITSRFEILDIRDD